MFCAIKPVIHIPNFKYNSFPCYVWDGYDTQTIKDRFKKHICDSQKHRNTINYNASTRSLVVTNANGFEHNCLPGEFVVFTPYEGLEVVPIETFIDTYCEINNPKYVASIAYIPSAPEVQARFWDGHQIVQAPYWIQQAFRDGIHGKPGLIMTRFGLQIINEQYNMSDPAPIGCMIVYCNNKIRFVSRIEFFINHSRI